MLPRVAQRAEHRPFILKKGSRGIVMEEIQKVRERSAMKRRGLLAGATALGAALVAKLGTADRAEAANGDPLVLGASNTATATTSLSGVAGSTGLFISVNGSRTIWAINEGNGVSVLAQGAGAVGMQAESATNAGVVGASTSNVGTYGQGKFGCWGIGLGGGAVGVYGAVPAANIPGGALGGLFDGPIVVNGGATINGDFAASGMKSAIVPNRRGQMVHLYSVEAPESYFEDFGVAVTGSDGGVTVDIPEDFREIAKTNEYHIFLSAYNRNGGLYVYEQREIGFIVRDSAGTSGVRFSWRIVCKRADIEGERFKPASSESRGLNVQRLPQPQLAGNSERPR
jgi:hypothetical protein